MALWVTVVRGLSSVGGPSSRVKPISTWTVIATSPIAIVTLMAACGSSTDVESSPTLTPPFDAIVPPCDTELFPDSANEHGLTLVRGEQDGDLKSYYEERGETATHTRSCSKPTLLMDMSLDVFEPESAAMSAYEASLAGHEVLVGSTAWSYARVLDGLPEGVRSNPDEAFAFYSGELVRLSPPKGEADAVMGFRVVRYVGFYWLRHFEPIPSDSDSTVVAWLRFEGVGDSALSFLYEAVDVSISGIRGLPN